MNLHRFQIRTRLRKLIPHSPRLIELTPNGPIEFHATPEEKRLLHKVKRGIHSDDAMLSAGKGQYFAVGLSALRCIESATQIANLNPSTILDMPSGHGRVLRFLKAKYPKAELTACDLDRGAVDFCASYFGARAEYSDVDLRKVNFKRKFSLVWVGSLFTHLDERRINDALELFRESLEPNGLLIFSTHGVGAVERIEAGETYGVDDRAMLESYLSSGFGYAPYPNQDYGVSLTSTAWVREKMRGWREVSFSEKGWSNHHDVYAYSGV